MLGVRYLGSANRLLRRRSPLVACAKGMPLGLLAFGINLDSFPQFVLFAQVACTPLGNEKLGLQA